MVRKHACSVASLVLSLSLTAVAAGQNGWVRQSPFPTDRTPMAVFALSPERAFFVGENNMIVETKTAGADWSIHKLSPWGTDPYYAVCFPTPLVGIISGNNGALRSTDGGATWNPIGFPAGSWSFLDFVSPTLGFAGANGACARSTDGGASFVVRSGYPNCPVMFGMDFIDANVGLVGGIMATTSDSGIYKTTDAGATWTKKDDGAANDVLWMSPTRAIADAGTTIRESLNMGETWQVIAGGVTDGVVSLARAGGSNVVCGVSSKGDVWRSPNGGYFWNRTFDGPGSLPGIWEIHFADELHGWIVGPGGFYYYTSDSGLTWQQKNSGCNAQVEDIQMLDANYGLAIGRSGYMFRTTNGGAFWDIQKLEVTGQIWGRDEDLIALDIVDAQFAATAGPGGTVFKTEDGGASWTSIGYPNLSTNFYIYDVDFIDHNLGYVYGVDFDPPHTRTLFRTRDGGASWEWVDLGERGGGTTVQFMDANTGWLTADNTFGLKTTDGGNTWLPFNLPEYFSGPEVSKVRFRTLNEGWAVGWNGYVAKTTNGGASWTLLNLSTIDDHLFDVVAVSSSEIWLCGREDFSFAGVVYRSVNGGQTWTRQVVTDSFYYPYRITALPSGDAWFGGFAGAIFRREVSTVIAEPQTYNLYQGVPFGGGLQQLLQSDDDYLVVGPSFLNLRTDDPIRIGIEGVSPAANPQGMELLLESRVNLASTQLKVDLWNYSLARWENVHVSTASLSDSTLTINAPAPLNRFVEPGTRKIKAQMHWRPNPLGTRNWRTFVDRAVWRIRP